MGSGRFYQIQKFRTIIFVIFKLKIEDIKEIVKSLEDSRILLKNVSEANENEMKEGKNGFIGMLFGTVGATLLGNLLVGK